MSTDVKQEGDSAATYPQENLYQSRWITDKAYLSGLSGIATLLLLAYLFHYYHVFEQGISLFHFSLHGRSSVTAFALLLTCFSMVVVELVRLWRYDKSKFIRYSPLWRQQRYSALVLDAGKKYLLNIGLLVLASFYYYCINEYGYVAQARYYQPWFQLFEFLFVLYLCLGFPYQFLTAAFKHDVRQDAADLLGKILSHSRLMFKNIRCRHQRFSSADKKIALGFLVKLFFTPIMSVFFFDNFHHLVSNISYIKSGLIPELMSTNYSHATLNRDLTNIVPTLIFTIDVALAWCGYAVSSRWLDNQTNSTEPTLIGWLVCLLSYPPFRTIPGWFISTPDEKMYLQLPDQTLVTVLAALMITSYFLYMLPTVFFGVRFSNLTHRGIIRTGPFAYVRHPAYTAKNMAWWCVGFPVAIYSGWNHGFLSMILILLGLLFMTGIYYLRAITEEKHLSIDPYYQAYCQNVKYRFIPNLI